MCGVGANVPRLALAEPSFVLFVPPLGSDRDVEPVADSIRDIKIETHFLLPVTPKIEVRRGIRSERGVDRVDDEQVGLVGSDTDACVPNNAAGREPAQASDRRRIGHVTTEVRGKTAGEPFLEGKAVRVGNHLSQGIRTGQVVGDGYRGTVGGALIARGQHVADEQGSPAVRAEDAPSGVGVPEEKAAGHLLVGVVCVSVELQAVAEQVAEIAEELEVVLNLGRAPDLGWLSDIGIASCEESRHVATLDAAVGRIGTPILEAEVGETCLAEWQPDVAGEGVRFAVPPLAEGPGDELEATAGNDCPWAAKLNHAGDGVRAVLRRRAAAQYLHLPQGNRRDD